MSAQWQSAVHNRDAYRLAAESGAPDLSALQASHQLADELDLAYLQGDAGPILGETLCGLQRVKRTVRDLLDFSRIDDGEWLSADQLPPGAIGPGVHEPADQRRAVDCRTRHRHTAQRL